MKAVLFAAATLAAALGACSKSKAPADADALPPAPAPAQPAQKTVFDTQLRALQKAKDVQKTVDQQKTEAAKNLDDQGG